VCPLKEKCPKDMRPKRLTSNSKSINKFGEECQFPHHQLELKFPESIITKLSVSHNSIKNLKGQINSAKPNEFFKPSGPHHDSHLYTLNINAAANCYKLELCYMHYQVKNDPIQFLILEIHDIVQFINLLGIISANKHTE
jgi:hypothetical protein